MFSEYYEILISRKLSQNSNLNELDSQEGLAVWRFKSILSAGLRFHSHISGGLRLRNYRAVAGKARGFRFLRVFVAVFQTELRRSED